MIRQFTAYEDSGVFIMSRILGPNGANLKQADVSSIAYSVFNVADPTVVTATGSLAPASAIFNTLQKDARWTEDTTGYNFRWGMGASILATGNTRYRVEVAFTPVSGEVFHVVWEITTENLYRS